MLKGQRAGAVIADDILRFANSLLEDASSVGLEAAEQIGKVILLLWWKQEQIDQELRNVKRLANEWRVR
jgi:hypothetical protein